MTPSAKLDMPILETAGLPRRNGVQGRFGVNVFSGAPVVPLSTAPAQLQARWRAELTKQSCLSDTAKTSAAEPTIPDLPGTGDGSHLGEPKPIPAMLRDATLDRLSSSAGAGKSLARPLGGLVRVLPVTRLGVNAFVQGSQIKGAEKVDLPTGVRGPGSVHVGSLSSMAEGLFAKSGMIRGQDTPGIPGPTKANEAPDRNSLVNTVVPVPPLLAASMAPPVDAKTFATFDRVFNGSHLVSSLPLAGEFASIEIGGSLATPFEGSPGANTHVGERAESPRDLRESSPDRAEATIGYRGLSFDTPMATASGPGEIGSGTALWVRSTSASDGGVPTPRSFAEPIPEAPLHSRVGVADREQGVGMALAESEAYPSAVALANTGFATAASAASGLASPSWASSPSGPLLSHLDAAGSTGNRLWPVNETNAVLNPATLGDANSLRSAERSSNQKIEAVSPVATPGRSNPLASQEAWRHEIPAIPGLHEALPPGSSREIPVPLVVPGRDHVEKNADLAPQTSPESVGSLPELEIHPPLDVLSVEEAGKWLVSPHTVLPEHANAGLTLAPLSGGDQGEMRINLATHRQVGGWVVASPENTARERDRDAALPRFTPVTRPGTGAGAAVGMGGSNETIAKSQSPSRNIASTKRPLVDAGNFTTRPATAANSETATNSGTVTNSRTVTNSGAATGPGVPQASSSGVIESETGLRAHTTFPPAQASTSKLENSNELARNPFYAIDSTKTLIAAPADSASLSVRGGNGVRSLDIGVHDPALGYVELRAHVGGGGIHASLLTQSASSGEVLEGHLSSLAGWMTARNTPVESLTVLAHHSAAGVEWEGNSGQRSGGQNSSQADREQSPKEDSAGLLQGSASVPRQHGMPIAARTVESGHDGLRIGSRDSRGVHISVLA